MIKVLDKINNKKKKCEMIKKTKEKKLKKN